MVARGQVDERDGSGNADTSNETLTKSDPPTTQK